MPDSQGNFKGVSVSRLYPGHRDYEPPTPADECCKGGLYTIECMTCPLDLEPVAAWDDGTVNHVASDDWNAGTDA